MTKHYRVAKLSELRYEEEEAKSNRNNRKESTKKKLKKIIKRKIRRKINGKCVPSERNYQVEPVFGQRKENRSIYTSERELGIRIVVFRQSLAVQRAITLALSEIVAGDK